MTLQLAGITRFELPNVIRIYETKLSLPPSQRLKARPPAREQFRSLLANGARGDAAT